MHTFHLEPNYLFDEKNTMNFDHYRKLKIDNIFIATLKLHSVVIHVYVVPSEGSGYALVDDTAKATGVIVKIKIEKEIILGHPHLLELFLLPFANKKIKREDQQIVSHLLKMKTVPGVSLFPQTMLHNVSCAITDWTGDSIDFQLKMFFFPEKTAIYFAFYSERLTEHQHNTLLQYCTSELQKYSPVVEIIDEKEVL